MTELEKVLQEFNDIDKFKNEFEQANSSEGVEVELDEIKKERENYEN
tara:strand:+ start:1741 stop:1881 length:141 start_codon:yes stop_codon:yes gene_type:complete